MPLSLLTTVCKQTQYDNLMPGSGMRLCNQTYEYSQLLFTLASNSIDPRPVCSVSLLGRTMWTSDDNG